MITLCTVVPESYEDFFNCMKSSMVNLKHISEVLVAVVGNSKEESISQWEENGVDFVKFNAYTPLPEHGHSMGLHACIDRSKNDLLLFCDPDLVFLNSVDQIYLDLMEKYELDYVGCSHHSAVANAYSFFPYLMNSLVDKRQLPPIDWLQGHLKFRNGCIMVEQLKENDDYELATGKFLISSPIPGYWDKLPNIKPNVFFDTGINLCLWSQEQNWKWLSFQTADAHLYTTKYYKSNFKMKDRLPLEKLIYHDVRRNPDNLKNMLN